MPPNLIDAINKKHKKEELIKRMKDPSNKITRSFLRATYCNNQ